MVLTRIAWVTVVTSASKVSYDHQFRRGIVGSRFLYNIDIKILKYEENRDQMQNPVELLKHYPSVKYF